MQAIEEADAREAAISVTGMTCASCVAHVEKSIKSVPGVEACEVNLARGRAVVRFDPHQTNPLEVSHAIHQSGYEAHPEDASISAASAEEHRVAHQHEHARQWRNRALVGFILWFPLEATHWTLYLLNRDAHAHHAGPTWMTWATLVASTIALVYVGSSFYRSAWKALLHRTSNMDTLIAMGSTVAYLYSLVALAGYLAGWWTVLPDLYFMEAAGLLALISLGHWLEARARDRAGSAIRELMNLAPPTAWRLKQKPSNLVQLRVPKPGDAAADEFEEVPIAELHKGDKLLVRPGDRVPVDGVVLEGVSEIDESLITGESLPVTKKPGDELIGGTSNTNGRLVLRATKVGSETALAQIVKLVESAQSSKPPVQRLADQISAIFVPTVLGIALVTGIAWYAWGATHDWSTGRTWAMIARAVCSVLIIACPCALGLAVPATLMVGLGRGAKRGILVRDIDALQSAERIDTVVLDKTGTITQGKPAVIGVVPSPGVNAHDVLRLAAGAEQFSEHPLAKAIAAHARLQGISVPTPQSFTNDPGHGVVAQLDGATVLVGNEALLLKHGYSKPTERPPDTPDPAQTLVHVARLDPDTTVRLLGIVALSDPIKPDSAEAIRALHAMNLRTLLLTGDNQATAEFIARQAGIDDVRAQVKPGGKADAIRELQRSTQHSVAMVGDGINDAPALAAADLGIAIGSGSDVAKETGDIVLVSGSLHGIVTSIKLSRMTMKKIRQNLFFAFLYNVLAIPLAAFGLLNPLIAAAAMALSDITVLGNALLLRRSKID